ncbi:hypothetical protein HYPSUDRAFT_727828 [Hypholoma sublateritium FD-334 SS-4]|uniref:Uncharacterized protein n=1 Tax=Hypholoma sublateritium (strain FD-334 SS-4) TaxID=945553 RepID=A0A0D2NYP9_HYPSF|nr:hypothetical protein HYPSUDRAFT_727828 [Hypholoma sublateritium FD-334 SS-4]
MSKQMLGVKDCADVPRARTTDGERVVGAASSSTSLGAVNGDAHRRRHIWRASAPSGLQASGSVATRGSFAYSPAPVSAHCMSSRVHCHRIPHRRSRHRRCTPCRTDKARRAAGCLQDKRHALSSTKRQPSCTEEPRTHSRSRPPASTASPPSHLPITAVHRRRVAQGRRRRRRPPHALRLESSPPAARRPTTAPAIRYRKPTMFRMSRC